ncbi:hypothetical protein EIL87_05730 [Saccharopolyspora rhizosphaerae]|uniref:Sigma-54 factor interaction domain-containing protein n=1 Tax=Saccharopolyspora rhizosphaerae TaxID=2492662 RepID=A0A3R8VJ10_9PSEU|nr:helix-turn-helix domain-containing protein [Saccharopolyspora rhizosphaerae]RRO18618.1 hypothetical protein EIL87_05730 [Saccharopolyspora rhizosphaerae]
MNGINEAGRPAPLPFDEGAVRRAKEALLTRGLLTSPVSQPGVRNIIERSWRRCIGEGVPPQPRFTPSRGPAERQSMLVDAARPVLERLSEHLADARVALFLSDDKGHIVMRKAAERRQRNELDNASAAEGFDFSERSVGTNTLGLGHVSSEAHALLWTHLRDSPVRREPRQVRVPLPTGWHDAIVEHVEGTEGERSAFCVRLLPADSHDAGVPPGTARTNSRAVTTSEPVHPRQDIAEQVSTAIRHRECLALDGEPGTGKLHVASAAFATHFPGEPPLVLDLSTYRRDNEDSWFTAAMEALVIGRGVVLRHLNDVAPSELNRIKAIAECSQDQHTGSPPLVLTIDTEKAPEHARTLIDQLATTVRLPALAEMPEQLPSLVTRILAAMPDVERQTRFSSDALQLLMCGSWPGNVAELRRTVEFLAHRMPGAVVGAGDLPTRMQQTAPHRQLTMMEAAERESISAALRQSGGNRSQAASALGIGRTTLYRKMRFYRLD